jgi:hypothetical protein
MTEASVFLAPTCGHSLMKNIEFSSCKGYFRPVQYLLVKQNVHTIASKLYFLPWSIETSTIESRSRKSSSVESSTVLNFCRSTFVLDHVLNKHHFNELIVLSILSNNAHLSSQYLILHKNHVLRTS